MITLTLILTLNDPRDASNENSKMLSASWIWTWKVQRRKLQRLNRTRYHVMSRSCCTLGIYYYTTNVSWR